MAQLFAEINMLLQKFSIEWRCSYIEHGKLVDVKIELLSALVVTEPEILYNMSKNDHPRWYSTDLENAQHSRRTVFRVAYGKSGK